VINETWAVLWTCVAVGLLPFLMGNSWCADLLSFCRGISTWWSKIREGLHFETEVCQSVVELSRTLKEGLQNSNAALGPNCDLSEADIREKYSSSDFDEEIVDGIVLVLKLTLSMNAYGHCSIDTETYAFQVANTFNLPSPFISCSHRLVLVVVWL
jgi:hypothetical protein